jgi:transcription antitermination factor NusG
VAQYFLERAGFEVYLPRIRQPQRRYNRRVEITRPFFPGYCFTRIELQWHDVRHCPGVIGLVKIGGDEPVPVPDEVIAAIRKRERNGAIDLAKFV